MNSVYRTRRDRYPGGVSTLGPLAAYIPTPRDDAGRLLTKTYEELIDGAVTAGATAIGLLGSTGGFAYLPRIVRRRAIRTALAVVEGRVPIIAGIGALTSAEVAHNLAEAEEAGVNGVLLPPVSYQTLTPDEVMTLYRDVASRTTTGIWVYNTPSTTQYRFGTEQLTRLARLRGVQGFKDNAASASQARERRHKVLAELPPRTAKRLDYGFSGDTMGAQVLIDGATTWHSSLAGLLPHLVSAIAYAATHNRKADARSLQRKLTALAVLAGQYGGIRVTHSLGEMLGYDMGTLPRPLLALPRDSRSLLRVAVRDLDVPEELSAEVADHVAHRAGSKGARSEAEQPTPPADGASSARVARHQSNAQG